MSARRLPSTDLYFAHTNTHLIARWWRRAPIKALGANCFVAGNTLILIRQDDPALMRRALDWPHRLIYLVDDDIGAAQDDPHLPDGYRRRLAAFDRDYHRRLLRRADILLVPSLQLADRLVDQGLAAAIRHIDPVWNLPIADQHHYAGLGRGAPLRIIHLGSGSHAGGLAAIAPAIRDVLDRHADVQFTYIARQPVHPALARTPQVRRLRPMCWPRYRRWLAGQRFHLAVYPLDLTPFDRARSGNKLIEHGVVGAAAIYPGDWAPAEILGGGAILATSDPANWLPTLIAAVSDRESLARIATDAAVALRRYNAPQVQRNLWHSLLKSEVDPEHG